MGNQNNNQFNITADKVQVNQNNISGNNNITNNVMGDKNKVTNTIGKKRKKIKWKRILIIASIIILLLSAFGIIVLPEEVKQIFKSIIGID